MGLSWALTQRKVINSASANKFSEFVKQANQKAPLKDGLPHVLVFPENDTRVEQPGQ